MFRYRQGSLCVIYPNDINHIFKNMSIFSPMLSIFSKIWEYESTLTIFLKKYWIYSSLYKRRNMAPGGVYEVLIYVLNLRQIERWKRSLSLSQLCSTVTLLMAATECQTLNIELAVGITEHHLKLQTQKWKALSWNNNLCRLSNMNPFQYQRQVQDPTASSQWWTTAIIIIFMIIIMIITIVVIVIIINTKFMVITIIIIRNGWILNLWSAWAMSHC